MRPDSFLDRARSEAAHPSMLSRVPGGLAAVLAGLTVVLSLGGVAALAYPYGDYFQTGAVTNGKESWFARHLRAMDEPALGAPRANAAAGVSELRVLVLPTWGHPVAVRYTFDTNGTTRRAVKLCGAGGYEPGIVGIDATSAVAPADASALLAALDASGYWTMPAEEEIYGLDGSEVLVETVRDGEHRVRARWTPEYDSKPRGLDGFIAFYTEALRRGDIATAQEVIDPACKNKR